MTDELGRQLSPEELDAQSGEELPDREVMSVISPDPDAGLTGLVDTGGKDPFELPPPPVAE